MIFLYDSNVNNNNALAQGATWFATRQRTRTPLDAAFYTANQGNLNLHQVVTMIGGNQPAINNNINQPLQNLQANEAVIIVAHGRYTNRTLHSEAGNLDVTQSVQALFSHLRVNQTVPPTVFIAACESGIATNANSILTRLINGAQGGFNGEFTVGGYVASVNIFVLGGGHWDRDSTGAQINGKDGTHIVGWRGTQGNHPAYHFGYDRNLVTTCDRHGTHSNALHSVLIGQLANQNAVSAWNNISASLNQERIPQAFLGYLENT